MNDIIEALCLAVDAQDPAAHLALADALEEAGDPRASVVRGGGTHIGHFVGNDDEVILEAGRPVPDTREFWYVLATGQLAERLEDLGGCPVLIHCLGGAVAFPHRSDALLAWAEARTAP